MTTTSADLFIATIQAIEDSSGTDLADWCALCDQAEEGIDANLTDGERLGLAWLSVVVRATRSGHRHAYLGRKVMALAARVGVLSFARTVAALIKAQGRRAEMTAAFFSGIARGWRYVGHRNVSRRQAEAYNSWRRTVEAVGGVGAGDFDESLYLVHTLCYTVAETLAA